MAELTITPAPAADPAAGTDVSGVKVESKGSTQVATISTENKTEEAPKGEQKPSRPEWLPEGFETPEALAKSYQELRTKMSQGKPAEPPKVAQPSADTPLVDLDGLAKEYIANGTLSEDTLKTLKTKGFTEDMVNTFIAGRKAQADNMVKEITSAAGSPQEVTEVLKFVKDNASEADIAAYNKAVDSGDTATAKRIFASFAADYRASENEPALLVGNTGGKGIPPYESWAQVQDDMKKPAYKKDPAFRNSVTRRMAVSDISKFA